MINIVEECGRNAGRIWETLRLHGSLPEPRLISLTKLKEHEFYAAIGWLARENKIFKNGSKYELRETNLTNKIGEDAGKIWNILTSQGNCDITSITKNTQITVKETYSAIGWLARENKIWMTRERSNKQYKIGLK